jgi:hypothetical protein
VEGRWVLLQTIITAAGRRAFYFRSRDQQ